MISINLTEDQVNQLLQLIDVAIKSGGYNVARFAVPMFEHVVKEANSNKQSEH